MKISEVFRKTSGYFNADDCKIPFRLRIESVVYEHVDPDEPEKPCLTFQGTNAKLPLNITNARYLGDVIDDEWDRWPGALVELYRARCEMRGRSTFGVRVRVIEKPPAAGPPVTDEIPF